MIILLNIILSITLCFACFGGMFILFDYLFNYLEFNEKINRYCYRKINFNQFYDEYTKILNQKGWTLDCGEFFSGGPTCYNSNSHFWKHDVVLLTKYYGFTSYIEYRKYIEFYNKLIRQYGRK